MFSFQGCICSTRASCNVRGCPCIRGGLYGGVPPGLHLPSELSCHFAVTIRLSSLGTLLVKEWPVPCSLGTLLVKEWPVPCSLGTLLVKEWPVSLLLAMFQVS